ncbi:MAG: methylamine metabolism protein [Bacteroidota bacterium]|jgi:cytochrome c peroxidase
MLHSRKLHNIAVFCLSVSILASCQKDIADQTIEIESARARVKSNLTPIQELGKQIFFDARLSEPVGVQACASCHAPQVGFSGFGDIPTGGAASAAGFKRGFVAGIGEGAVVGAFGNRKPPTAAYSNLVPPMVYDPVDNAFVGGLFWDGRATGLRLGSTAAEQALGPFLADKEQNHPGPAAVLAKLKNNRSYIALWQKAYGTTDINTSTDADIALNYDRIGLAVAEYEASKEVSPFSAKIDAVLAGTATLTPDENAGMQLFLGAADCAGCHTQSGGKIKRIVVGEAFTGHDYENIGLPKNPDNPGSNVAPDLGLGGFLATSNNPTWRAQAAANNGKFRTPTLRNVAKAQRFMHNGVLRSLEEVVHFYNTRDVPGAGFNGRPWGTPDYPATMNVDGAVGNLGLTLTQEAQIVAFMRTLSDGYTGVTQ